MFPRDMSSINASLCSSSQHAMVTIRSIEISPPLINTACAWASDETQLTALFNCPYTGAVTTRTTTLGGFEENASHMVSPTPRPPKRAH